MPFNLRPKGRFVKAYFGQWGGEAYELLSFNFDGKTAKVLYLQILTTLSYLFFPAPAAAADFVGHAFDCDMR